MFKWLNNIIGGAKNGEPPFDAGPALAALERWNRNAMDSWAHGYGKTWEADQDTGKIEVTLRGGRKITFPLRFMGTFNPHDGSFLWANRNSSLKPELISNLEPMLDAHPDVFPEKGKQELRFAPVLARIAQAGMLGGHGVFRAIDDERRSIFLALDEPQISGTPLALPPSGEEISEAQQFVEAYLDRQLEVDAAYYALPEDDRFGTDAGKALSARRLELATEVMKKPKEDAGYFGWPSSFDRSEHQFSHAGPHPDGGVQYIACRSLSPDIAYRLRKVKGNWRIENRIDSFDTFGILWAHT